ncbi:protein CLP1 homolog [Penaeus japonicus]|uniref:protein CLP1 homolog n=1 Tax=Penaeus japonicus TaxID=27405 RepID=UPI001C70B244|nr:protein CLP1 homolog [Penaeus japonicus]XP_042869024.1 protein CLP1 homolog [Penaeus japonicus]
MSEKEFRLDPDSELRFEVEGKQDTVDLTLVNGKAEVFGTELAPDKPYTFFPGAKVAVFTWHGCVLKLSGPTEGTYVAKETPMIMYLNTHACLERLRKHADEGLNRGEDTRGPVTMVVGPGDVGKSTLCRILLNYAVRMGRRPIFVDLDIGQGSIAIPGTIGALLVERAADVGEGFSQEAPLVYNFGHLSPASNMTLYNILVSRMAATIQDKMVGNRKVAASGVVINTCGWIKNEGYKSLTHVAQAFEVDVIIVLDQERLYNELVRDIPFIRVVFLPKSGGVVERTQSMRASARDDRIREYYYGLRTKYHPHSFEVKMSTLQIYKIGAPALPDSCMPADMKVDDHMTKLVPVEPSVKLKHHMLAVSLATDPEDLLTSNVAGFICVLDVDEDLKVMKVLSPQPKPLPKTILILTEIQFMDSS